MRVTSPGEGPWKKNSGQVVSWDCVECSSDEDVIVRIIQIIPYFHDYREVFEDYGKNANTGHLDFTIGEDWDENSQYFAEVSLKDNPHVSADGVIFGIEN
ncbi:hypothetical protein RclHR1_02280016 [Rhizophagus clarus]|uniref:Uncharacterized protein n=1 Tax=Rhizophagus clarus TaxID=94130 RepID=A0A2Z6QUP0_9GLOM|nr:hypothetical protein RclHR1_02280016 [Rhizophagus clarus]GES75735.1 hypothetical protein GLOIN_2v1606651 [Rhizophagus clarus]